MKASQFDREELEQLINRTEERQAPPWLLPRVMAEIEERQPPLAERLRRWWLRPRPLRLSPARLVLTGAAALCIFWLGIMVGQMHRPGEGHGPVLAESGEANFLIGRGLLAAGRVDQALPFLRRAVQQEPSIPEFSLWQGVAYGELGKREQERASYQLAAGEEHDFLPALLNLGHTYLESGQYQQALAQYDKVLVADPEEPSALYNRALAYLLQGDAGRAEQAFLGFLERHRTGKWAFRALGHLHRLGNFTFRSYRLGAARLVLKVPALLGADSANSRQELRYLAEALAQAPESELHLVAYRQGDRQAAKAAVDELQAQLLSLLGRESAIRIRASWFDVAENFSDANGVDRQAASGLLIFTRPIQQDNQTKSI